MIELALYILGFILLFFVIGLLNNQLQRRHERKLANITGEHPREWNDD